MTKTVTAYEARTKSGEFLNEVYYKGDEIIIKKFGATFVARNGLPAILLDKLSRKC